MPQRIRKLIGTFLITFGLIFYVLVAAAAGAVALPDSTLVKLIYYPVAGIIWIFPVRGLMVWMNRPDEN